MRPRYEPSVTRATGEVDRQFYRAHERCSAVPRGGRGRTHDERTAGAAEIIDARRHAVLARAVREASQRLLFQAAGATAKSEPALASAAGEADQQFDFAHEIRPALARVGGDQTHDEHPSAAAVVVDAKDSEEHAGIARAVREASQRLRFQRELWSTYWELSRDDARKEFIAFEAALAHVDSAAGRRSEEYVAVPEVAIRLPARRSIRRRSYHQIERRRLGEPREPDSVHQAVESQASVVAIPPIDQRHTRTSPRRLMHVAVGVLIIAAAFATGLWARNAPIPLINALWRITHPMVSSLPLSADRYAKSPPAAEGSPPPIATAAASPARFSIPLPDSYGLYALNDGRLTRIESMHIRVPDARIALPGLVTTPSPVVLPDGRLRFIAYQRDLVTSAPDTASIRIIARVARALTFAATGRPKAHPVENTWAIREVSGEMAVAPIPGRPEMILIKPSDPNLALSPGRYMLVFKNQAYDFTVDGAATDPAQCLERSETQDGNVYSECPGAD